MKAQIKKNFISSTVNVVPNLFSHLPFHVSEYKTLFYTVNVYLATLESLVTVFKFLLPLI